QSYCPSRMMDKRRRLFLGQLLSCLGAGDDYLFIYRCIGAGAQPAVVFGGLMLTLVLATIGNCRAQVLGTVTEGIDEILCVWAQAIEQNVHVAREGACTLHRKAAIHQVPTEILFDQGKRKDIP